MVFLKNEKFA